MASPDERALTALSRSIAPGGRRHALQERVDAIMCLVAELLRDFEQDTSVLDEEQLESLNALTEAAFVCLLAADAAHNPEADPLRTASLTLVHSTMSELRGSALSAKSR